jgi:hypothetical protein
MPKLFGKDLDKGMQEALDKVKAKLPKPGAPESIKVVGADDTGMLGKTVTETEKRKKALDEIDKTL